MPFWIFKSDETYAYTDYRYYTTLAKNTWNDLYAKFPDTQSLRNSVSTKWNDLYAKFPDTQSLRNSVSAKWNDLYAKFPDTAPFFWNNKEVILGGAAIAVALLAIGIAVKKWPRTQKVEVKQTPATPPLLKQQEPAICPTVEFKTSLNIAKMKIRTPKEKLPPLKKRLIFCIDKSSSMAIERESQVKAGVEKVLRSTQKIIDSIEGSSVETAIVAFNNYTEVVVEPIEIGKKPIEDIIQQFQSYKSSGGTEIITGLKKSIELLTQMENNASHYDNHLILLSDGEQKLSEFCINDIHQSLSNLKAKFYAVGIGDGHNQTTLQSLAPEAKGYTYIDTTKKKNPITIEGAIEKIYQRAIAQYREVTLSSKQLDAGTWVVNKAASKKTQEGSMCKIVPLNEGTKHVFFIKIFAEKLKQALDLSKVTFDLSFEDPYGRTGEKSFSWQPHIAYPDLFSEYENHQRV